MKRSILSGVMFGLACLAPLSAQAQTVITPKALMDQGSYNIADFSISSQDTTIAFNVMTNPPDQVLPIWNLWTTSRSGAGSLALTDFGDSASAKSPGFNSTNFIGFIETQEKIPSGNKEAPERLALIGATASTPIDFLTPSNLHVDSFSWSLDPSQLVITARDENDPAFGTDLVQDNIYVVTLPGVVHKLMDCPPFSVCGAPQWSANENVIALTEHNNIVLINPDGSGKHTILTNASSPVWSPNANRLAFSCGDDICTSEGDGSNVRNVTNGAGGLIYSSPSWPADESLLVMQAGKSRSPFAEHDVYVVSPDGANSPIALTNTHNARSPQWDPLDNQIYYICANHKDGFDNYDLCVIDEIGIPQGGVCDPTTCSGCCLENICFPGDTRLACGINGGACSACAGQKVCSSLGFCEDPSQCDIANCPDGCCDAHNQCLSGKLASACGTGGQACAKCNNGEICDGGKRLCETELCSAANCAGCCGADGKCNAGTTSAACGSNGFACQACTGGATCNASRVCESQHCDASNCNGCCDPNGVCHQSSASHCGYNGLACVTCGSGQVCDANSKTCESPQTCNSSNCNGCCGADNACHGGNNTTSCGFSGFTCSDCSPGKCLSGSCQ